MIVHDLETYLSILNQSTSVPETKSKTHKHEALGGRVECRALENADETLLALDFQLLVVVIPHVLLAGQTGNRADSRCGLTSEACRMLVYLLAPPLELCKHPKPEET